MSYSNIQPLLREKYGDHVDVTLDVKGISPILACFEAKADDDGEGRGFIFPITVQGQRVASATFATSQTKNRSTTSGFAATHDRWVVPAAEISGFAAWTRQEINAAKKSGPERMFDVIDKRYVDAVRDIRQQLAIAAVEGGYGLIGQLSAISTTTITFASASVVNRVEKGDSVVFSATESGGVLLASAGEVEITTVNYDTGVCGVSDDPTTGGTPATSTSYVFRSGNRENAASPSKLLPTGLKGWIGTGDLYGITGRSGVPRLSGHSVSASGLDHTAALKKLVNRLSKAGCEPPDTIFVSQEDHEVLELDKEIIKNVSMELGVYKIGFKGLAIYGANGNVVNIVADIHLPQGTAYGGPFNHPEFRPQMKFSKQLIAIDDFDGNDILRLDASAGYEMRLFANVAMALPAVGMFGKVTSLPSS
jgi:hypothetical protein